MSLTNPETVVTEERLSEFYTGILPYLGGMPEIVANKFSKGDLYSTDEKMVGQWVDGRPIYKKTITGLKTPTQTSPTAQVVCESLSSWNIDNLIDLHCVYKITNGACRTVRTSGHERVYPNGTGSGQTSKQVTPSAWLDVQFRILFIVEDSDELNCDLTATLYYTKTTDSAISIGSDTDYSTTEKIVGTWIDGKPIYQKTISTVTSLTAETLKTVKVVDNVDRLISANGEVYFQSEKWAILLGEYTKDEPGDSYWKAIVYRAVDVPGMDNNSVQLEIYAMQTQNATVGITIQYTKTTD